MKIDLPNLISAFPFGPNYPIRLLSNVSDPATQNVLHRRDEILYMEAIARLHDVHSIDYVEATYMTNHSER